MIKIEIADTFHGKQLIQEMKDAGVVVYENLTGISAVVKESNGEVFIPTSEEFAELAQQVANSHVPVFKEDTVVDKLAAAGLTVEELKQALGL